MNKIKYISIVFFLICSGSVFSQSVETEVSCYDEWRKLFKSRECDVVVDGEYEYVIVSLRSENKSTCYNGRAVVTKGLISEIQIKLVNGEVESVLFDLKQDYKIIKGVSEPMDGRIRGKSFVVNVFFKNNLKPKRK